MASLATIAKLKAAALRNRKMVMPALHMTADNIEDLLNIDKVRALEKIFTYFEQENKRCMDMLEFRTAMRKVGL